MAKDKDFNDRLGALEQLVKGLARGTRQDVRGDVSKAPAQPRKAPAGKTHASAGGYWTGDDGETSELLDAVRRLLTGSAKNFREIVEATGAACSCGFSARATTSSTSATSRGRCGAS